MPSKRIIRQQLLLCGISILLLVLTNHNLWILILNLDDSPHLRELSTTLYMGILVNLGYLTIKNRTIGELWTRDFVFQILLVLAGILVTFGSHRIKAGQYPQIRLIPLIIILLLATRGLMVGARYHFPNKGWKSGIATSIWAILTVLLIAEMIFSQIGETHGSVRTLANLTWHARYSKPLNSLGAPDVEHNHEDLRNPRRAKILYLGDSFTAGAGLDNFLEDRYSSRVRNIGCPEVPWSHINMGWGGASQKEEQAMLTQYDFPYDAVVLSYLPNDIYPVAVTQGKAPETASIDYQGLNFASRFLIDHSYLLNWIYWHKANGYHSDYIGTLCSLYENEEVLNAHLQELGALVDDLEGKPFIGVIFPILYDIPRQHRFLDRVSTFLENRGGKLVRVDRFPDLLRSPTDFIVNKNDLHPNEALHAIVADSISQLINNSDDLRDALCRKTTSQSSQ